MNFWAILLFSVFIPRIYSKPLDSSDTQTVPWDAYEYAKNISKQLSNELLLNMNKYPDGLKDFDRILGSTNVHFYNGTADYSGDSINLANSIANGTFYVKIDDNKTIIEFAPLLKNFSVMYNVVEDKRPDSNQMFGIVYDEIPISINIERHHNNGSIIAKINYRDSEDAPTKLSFGKDYDAYWSVIEHTHANLKDVDVPELKKELYQEFLSYNFKEQLCNLFESKSKFLQPQLENIVKMLPFPTQNMTATRWEEISQKVNENGLKELYTNEFQLAVLFTTLLQKVLVSSGQSRTWPSIDIPLPPKLRSNSSADDMLHLDFGYAEGIEIEFAFYYAKEKIKKGSFSIQNSNDTKTIRFAPNFPNYVIGYVWKMPGLTGRLFISYKTLPIEIEIKQKTNTKETTAKIFYHDVLDKDERVIVESFEDLPSSPSKKANYEKMNFVITEFYQSADFRHSIRGIFEPGSTYLQDFINVMALAIGKEILLKN